MTEQGDIRTLIADSFGDDDGPYAGTVAVRNTLARMMAYQDRAVLAADSTLAANVIGAATEAAHTSFTLAAAVLHAREFVRFKAMVHVVSSNAADTWNIRVRIGPNATGLASRQLLFTGGAINIANDNVFVIEGGFQVKSIGAAGKLLAEARMYDPVGTAMVVNGAVDGTLDTTVAQILSVTGECDTNNAGNQVALKHFEYEIVSGS